MKTGYQGAGPWITKTKTMTVLLRQDMGESYDNKIGWHTDIHPIQSLHMHQDNYSHNPNSLI